MNEQKAEAPLARLHANLVSRAEEEELLDVAYREVDSPLGPLLVAATERGVVRVAFAHEDPERVLADLADRVSPRVLRAPRRLDPVVTALADYLEGRARQVDVDIDLRLLSGYRREVVAALPAIGYGTTTTYAELATATGRPRAARAVGSACAKNPVPLVLPCHRVVRSDGQEGGYRGGPEVRRALLALEHSVAWDGLAPDGPDER